MYGRAAQELADLESMKVDSDVEGWKKYWEQIKQLVYPALAEKASERTQQKNLSFAKSHQMVDSPFPADSMVMIKREDRTSKWDPYYTGPYFIVRRNRGGAYILKDRNGKQLTRAYSPNQLKLISSEMTDDDQRLSWEIEKILDHKQTGDKLEFLVHWKGFDTIEDSWVKQDDMDDVGLIQDYMKGVAKTSSQKTIPPE
jgi:hypothetical protein